MQMAMDIAVLYDGVLVSGSARDNSIPLAAEEDAALVARARQGEAGAFEELVRRYRNDVYGLSYHFVRDREEAWDISQEVFIKAYRALGRFRGASGFKTWLLRITSNQCKDHFKKRRLDTVRFEEGVRADAAQSAAGPSANAEAHELGEAIGRALAQLPAKHRTAFVLREYEGMSYQQMAETMGCTLGTVMSRLHHARKKLQTILVNEGVVEDGLT